MNINPTFHQRACLVCSAQQGLLTCEGCQSTFCSRHVGQHRQELSKKLSVLIDEQEHLDEHLHRRTNDSAQMQKIDLWEKESIRKIRLAAETARRNLHQVIEFSKQRLTKLSRQLANQMNTSYETDQFSEIDLNRWKKQLADLRVEMTSNSTSNVQLIENRQAPLFLLSVGNQNVSNEYFDKLFPSEKFSKASPSISIEENGRLVRHVGPDMDYGHILGEMNYSQSRHLLSFQIEQFTAPYMIFFGCISTNRPEKNSHYKSSSVVGWFGYNEIYQHGIWNNNARIHGYESEEIQQHDRLDLTFDCEKKIIELYHPRINRTYKLTVNLDKAPLPWKLLVVLTHPGDCVRMMHPR